MFLRQTQNPVVWLLYCVMKTFPKNVEVAVVERVGKEEMILQGNEIDIQHFWNIDMQKGNSPALSI
jgi:hypothetical protein